MTSTQTLKLLDALLTGSSGNETEKLKALYKNAYCNTESFRDLTLLLERSEFHGTIGSELLTKSESVVKAGFTDAGSFGDNITVMEYLVEKIQKERQRAEEYVKSACVNGEVLNVIDKRLADQATECYEKLFRYVCCLYASLYGDTVLKNLNVKTGIRSVDLIRNVDDELSILLAEARRRETPKVWRILRKPFGGLNMMRYNGFVLEYGGITTDYLENQCDQLSPALFVPKNSFDVLCCGVGYLTSLSTATGASIFGAHVTTNPAMNCMDDLDLDYSQLNISLLLGKIAGSGVCVVKPEVLVEILNRYFMIREARKNSQTGCALCGKAGCRHIIVPAKYSMNDKPLVL